MSAGIAKLGALWATIWFNYNPLADSRYVIAHLRPLSSRAHSQHGCLSELSKAASPVVMSRAATLDFWWQQADPSLHDSLSCGHAKNCIPSSCMLKSRGCGNPSCLLVLSTAHVSLRVRSWHGIVLKGLSSSTNTGPQLLIFAVRCTEMVHCPPSAELCIAKCVQEQVLGNCYLQRGGFLLDTVFLARPSAYLPGRD